MQKTFNQASLETRDPLWSRQQDHIPDIMHECDADQITYMPYLANYTDRVQLLLKSCNCAYCDEYENHFILIKSFNTGNIDKRVEQMTINTDHWLLIQVIARRDRIELNSNSGNHSLGRVLRCNLPINVRFWVPTDKYQNHCQCQYSNLRL